MKHIMVSKRSNYYETSFRQQQQQQQHQQQPYTLSVTSHRVRLHGNPDKYSAVKYEYKYIAFKYK